MKMEEQKKNELFREKSLEAVQSPDSLNDYLKVTSPGVWLILSAVIALLIGVLIWSIFGRIETTREVAVISENGQCVCLIPCDDLNLIDGLQAVTIDGNTYALKTDTNASTEIISEYENPYVLLAGNLEVGDVVIRVPVETERSDGVCTGTIVTERIRPIALLLQ